MPNNKISGKYLNSLWGVNAKHALFRRTGDWYHKLTEFPGALFDANGYVIFIDEEDFYDSPYLQIKQNVHIPDLLENIPGYVRISNDNQFTKLSIERRKQRPKRQLIAQNRIIRDTKVSCFVKELYNYQCQLCGETIELSHNRFYAEGHHIQPLGDGHNGPDIINNVICVCPKHHVLLDYGVIRINLSEINLLHNHKINEKYINYHNNYIYNSNK